jgi:hypothetical protein
MDICADKEPCVSSATLDPHANALLVNWAILSRVALVLPISARQFNRVPNLKCASMDGVNIAANRSFAALVLNVTQTPENVFASHTLWAIPTITACLVSIYLEKRRKSGF